MPSQRTKMRRQIQYSWLEKLVYNAPCGIFFTVISIEYVSGGVMGMATAQIAQILNNSYSSSCYQQTLLNIPYFLVSQKRCSEGKK